MASALGAVHPFKTLVDHVGQQGGELRRNVFPFIQADGKQLGHEPQG